MEISKIYEREKTNLLPHLLMVTTLCILSICSSVTSLSSKELNCFWASSLICWQYLTMTARKSFRLETGLTFTTGPVLIAPLTPGESDSQHKYFGIQLKVARQEGNSCGNIFFIFMYNIAFLPRHYNIKMRWLTLDFSTNYSQHTPRLLWQF